MKSVRYFLPDTEFHCVSFFKNFESEYDEEEPLDSCIKNTYLQTGYVVEGDAPADHVDDRFTSGFGNIANGFIFSEGYNAIYNLFRGSEEKVLVLAEDHLFTSGVVLKELVENDFDVALAPWDHGYNGSILAFRPSRVASVFPIDLEKLKIPPKLPIEHLLLRMFDPERHAYLASTKKHIIKNRYCGNYFGDGFYTNSSEKIKKAVDNLYENGPFDAGSDRGVNTNIDDVSKVGKKIDTFTLGEKTFIVGSNGVVCSTNSKK